MRASGRFERYVVSTRDDGKFQINFLATNASEIRALCVCQNCLEHIQYHGFSHETGRTKKQKIVDSFSLQAFFQEYPKSLHPHYPKYNSADAPLNDYPSNWDSISRAIREAAHWRCQGPCGRNFSALTSRKFLHVHHVNGLKHDNIPTNLRALCIECHANETQHGYLTGC
jgi:hypothetical protein